MVRRAKVRLLSQIGGYPAGTDAVVVSVSGDTCEIEIEPDRRFTIDCNAPAPAHKESEGSNSGRPRFSGCRSWKTRRVRVRNAPAVVGSGHSSYGRTFSTGKPRLRLSGGRLKPRRICRLKPLAYRRPVFGVPSIQWEAARFACCDDDTWPISIGLGSRIPRRDYKSR